jgi:F-type H+-transporting ATPase subunit b
MPYLLGYIVVFIVLAGAANFFALPPQAQEAAKTVAEDAAFWTWWNYAWKIINFLALAFVIVKLAKKPLKDFVKKQRETASEDIAEMEERKKEAKAEQERIAQMTAGLAKELADFEAALTEAAAKDREAMLEDAQAESKLVLERAEIWAEQALIAARQNLAAEMLDQAAEIATETIRKNITDQDRQQFFDQFNSGLKESASL